MLASIGSTGLVGRQEFHRDEMDKLTVATELSGSGTQAMLLRDHHSNKGEDGAMSKLTSGSNGRIYTESSDIDQLALHGVQLHNQVQSNGGHDGGCLGAEYEHAMQALYERCLFRYVNGTLVPGVIGKKFVEKLLDSNADISGAMLRSLKRWDRRRPFVPYLRRALRNAQLDAHRKRYDFLSKSAANASKPAPTGAAPASDGSKALPRARITFPLPEDRCDDVLNRKVDAADTLRTAMNVLFQISPADCTFIWFLRFFGRLSYDEIAARLNGVFENNGNGRMRPFYSAECLRKRMERFCKTILKRVESNPEYQEAIESFLMADDHGTIGYLPEEKIDEFINMAREHLLKMETRLSVVKESVDAVASDREARQTVESILSERAKAEAFGRLPRFYSLTNRPYAFAFAGPLQAHEDPNAPALLKLYRMYVSGRYNPEDGLPPECVSSGRAKAFRTIVTTQAVAVTT